MRHVVRGGLAVLLVLLGGCSCGSTAETAAHAGDAGGDVREDARRDARPHDAGHDRSDGAEVTATCDGTDLGRGCVSGVCTLTGPAGALSAGATVTVTEMPAPAGLAGDVLGTSLCSLTVSGIKSVPNLTLSIAQSEPAPSDAVLFQYVAPDLSQWVVTSQGAAKAVEGIVAAPGSYGATRKPAGWTPQGIAGIDVSASGNQAQLLRNLSGQRMSAADYDGTRLFVCNGPRVLIYNKMPANPGVLPDVVLGQPDVDTGMPGTSSSLFGAAPCNDLWTDGSRLVVSQGSRVLIWDTIPTANSTPADVVLGQPDFASDTQNNGGVSASSLIVPSTVDSNGSRLAVADTFNNRVLLWNTFPTLIDQPADLVVGQPNFATNGQGTGATSVYPAFGAMFTADGLLVSSTNLGVVHVPTVATNNPQSDYTLLPWGLGLVPSPSNLFGPGRTARTADGGLAVRDQTLNRVLMMKSLPTGPASVDFVLGQPDTTRVVSNPVSASVVQTSAVSESGLNGGKKLLVPDSNRLLIFDGPPSYNFAPASRVLGQPGFTTNGQVDYRGISASTLAAPADVSINGGFLAVADEGNSRVLLYRASDVAANNLAAAVVVGQPNATSYVPNGDQVSPTSSTLSGPAGVALDGTHLIVSDTQNHRVLIWNTVPTASGTPADVVIGQADFASNRPNHGNGDADGDGFCDADAKALFYPTGVASDGSHLFVADRVNNRVLVWKSFPTANGQAADLVIGQASFSDVQANAKLGAYAVAANGLNLPTGVTIVGTSVWIADTENNRAVRWDNASTVPAPGVVVGQPSDSVVTNPNYQWQVPYVGYPTSPVVTTSSSMLHPRSVVVNGDRLYISELDSNRVHMWNAVTFAPAGELGQPDDASGAADTAGVTAATLAAPGGLALDGTNLWVADAGNHRVLAFGASTDPVTGTAAIVALGQASFLTNGFNETSTAAGGATSQPRGLAMVGSKLYVADTSNHRVTVFTTPSSAGQTPEAVYGQPDYTLSLANSGGAVSASTLNAPRGVFADASHVIVADTGNNRVLVYDATSLAGAATLVLGQSSFSSSAAGTPSAQTMNGPTGAYSDGTSLWVADTGNSRVLVWKTFPASNGQAADLVLGQASFSGDLPNQGVGAASAASLSLPSDVIVVSGVLYIADSGNNRLLLFKTAPMTSGAAADGALGQTDLTGRLPAATPGDMMHLAGPVKFAADAENLYVADRDLGRVVVYESALLKPGGAATRVLGVQGGLDIGSPGGVAVSETKYFTSDLYVADTGSNRIDIVAGVSRLAGD